MTVPTLGSPVLPAVASDVLLIVRFAVITVSASESLAASAVLVMVSAGQLRVIDACCELAVPSLVLVAVAVFFSVPQLAKAVPLVMWTLALAPAARSPKLQERVWLGAVPVTEQLP